MLKLDERIYLSKGEIAYEVKIIAIEFKKHKDDSIHTEFLVKYLEGKKKGSLEVVYYTTYNDVFVEHLGNEETFRFYDMYFYKDKTDEVKQREIENNDL